MENGEFQGDTETIRRYAGSDRQKPMNKSVYLRLGGNYRPKEYHAQWEYYHQGMLDCAAAEMDGRFGLKALSGLCRYAGHEPATPIEPVPLPHPFFLFRA
ncbi:MAG: hypothetical protein ACLU9S_04180 [Oscillospiraceae bacterium]